MPNHQLTHKQEKFILAVVEGKTQADAYRHAYNASNMSADTIINKASKLMARDDIRARYNELRAKVVERAENKAIFTVESILIDLKELIERNKNTDDRVALEGMKTVAKHLGMFVDKIETSGEQQINVNFNIPRPKKE